MGRVAALAVAMVAVQGLLLAPAASAALPLDEIRAALLTSAQARHVSGTQDPLADVDSWCSYPSEGPGVVTCSRSWPGDTDTAVLPTGVRIGRHPDVAAAKRAFSAEVLTELVEVTNLHIGTTVVTSSPSMLMYIVGKPIPGAPALYDGYGLTRVGRLDISVSRETTGPATPTVAGDCTSRLLAAQAAKAHPLATR